MMVVKHVVSLLGVGLASACLAVPAQTPGFERIISELDVGGDYLEVVNASTFQADIEAVLDLVQQGAVEAGALPAAQLGEIRKAREALKAAGFLSLRGCGASVRAQTDGSFVHRSFVWTEKGRNPALDLFACTVRPASVEAYLPRTTAAALSFSLDVKGTALFAADQMEAFGAPHAEALRAFCEPAGGQPSLADGIAPGTLVALTLDAKRPWTVPGNDLVMPTPGMLVVQAVQNGQLWSMLKMGVMASVRSSKATCSATPHPDYPGVDRLVFSVRDLKPLNMQPAWAYDRKGKALLFASSVEVLDAALAAGVKKTGRLFDDAGFLAHAKAPEALSGFVFLSPQVVPAMADLARQGLAKERAPVPPSVQKLLAEPPSVWSTGVFTRMSDGVKSEACASYGACNTLRLLASGSPASAVGMVGVLAGAIFPAVSQAQRSAQTSAMAMRGRNLFVGIVKANTEREATGLASVWPRTKADEEADKDDIAGRAFESGCDYFGTLFDIAKHGTTGWQPFVNADPSVLGATARAGRTIRAGGLDWCIAANVADEMDDNVPVLVSANFNPALLLARWDGVTDARKMLPIGPASGAAKSLFGDKAIVIVRKGGASQVIQAKYLTYAALYNRQAFDAPSLMYLTPTGVARPKTKMR